MTTFNDSADGDRVIIEELRVPARIGVYDHEKGREQMICLSLEIGLASQACFRSDSVEDTIDYAGVADALRRLAVSQHFNLVEFLAEQVSRVVLDEFGALWVKVRARKIGVVPGAQFAGVVITRCNVKALGLADSTSAHTEPRHAHTASAAVIGK